jgi:hypothetical protein
MPSEHDKKKVADIYFIEIVLIMMCKDTNNREKPITA